MLVEVFPKGRRGAQDFRIDGDAKSIAFDGTEMAFDPGIGKTVAHLGEDGQGIRDDALDAAGAWRAGDHPVSDVRIRVELKALGVHATFALTHRLAGHEEERSFVIENKTMRLMVGHRSVDLGPCEVPLCVVMETIDGQFRMQAEVLGQELLTLFEGPRDTVRYAGRSELSIAVSGGSALIANLEVHRDVHYFWRPEFEGMGPYYLDRGYFMAGDNGALSSDSRDQGPILGEALLGKVVRRVAPLHRWGKLP
jgi:hypothetical protein